jgi:hypothetical protein
LAGEYFGKLLPPQVSIKALLLINETYSDLSIVFYKDFEKDKKLRRWPSFFGKFLSDLASG